MINVTDLQVRFGKKKALDGVNLTIEQGECLLLAGANGAGKTTLLRSLAGVLRAQSGKIIINNTSVGPLTQEKTAYIPASLSTYDHLKLSEAVTLHGSFYRHFHFSYREMGGFSLDMNRKIGSLSRGEKTIFFLSLALSTAPHYLLIDDVIHYLDPYLRDIFLNIIMQLLEEEQLAVIIAAQSAVDIEGVLERVTVLNRGKIVLDNSVETLKRTFVRIYTDKPLEDPEIATLPVVFQRDWAGMKELYVYPYETSTKLTGKLEYLTLTEILKAFIGGEYALS